MSTRLDFNRRPPALGPGAWSSRLHAGRMFGVRAWWSVHLNHSELARRKGVRLSRLQRLDVVDVLLRLPIDLPVAQRQLSTRDVRILASLPSRILERNGDAVVRRVCPPLQVEHVVVPAREFRRGLEATSSFSTYCAGSMVLSRGAGPTETDLAEADYYGVGVYLATEDRLVELVAPEPMANWPETPASWVFSERLCEQLTPLGRGARSARE